MGFDEEAIEKKYCEILTEAVEEMERESIKIFGFKIKIFW